MIVPLLAAVTMVQGAPAQAQARADNRIFELRTYYAMPGKLDALNARFRNHTLMLFRRHGITNIGYWVPQDNRENVLIYVLAFPSREARDKSFAEFGADPEWKRAVAESEKDGPLVQKVTSTFMQVTDYSPPVEPRRAGRQRLFELRVYTANSGRLDALNARFRDHTLGLFKKHGMTNVAYWTPTTREQGSEDTLIYLLAHKSREAAAKSWAAFQGDPDWVKARTESEKDGPILFVSPKSTFLVPTDYSPTR